MMTVRVRTPECMVWDIHPVTWEPLHTSCYEAYCFSDPESGVTYISVAEWYRGPKTEKAAQSN